ncbi:hypothetical protein FHW20_004783 [Ochrobactrum intermedium]|uniref:Uncharacterized protein n=1 Tax=Brucella intermedia TaxID=94625 RepID=A0ABR6AWG2_9HYPH|nr:hypothetical protein [Brucella intermedia]
MAVLRFFFRMFPDRDTISTKIMQTFYARFSMQICLFRYISSLP